MKILIKILCASFFIISLQSCTKNTDDTGINQNCPAVETFSLTSNSPVVVGWPLEVKLPYIYASGKYVWTGPNGFHVESTATSDLTQSKITTTFADSGIYILKIIDINDGCTIAEGSTKVSIISSPTAPCNASLTNNASTSTLFGVGNGSYSGQQKTTSGSYISFFANCTDGSHLNINFNNYSDAQPGTYTTSDGFYPDQPASSVGIYYQTGLSQFTCKSLQKVYVTKTGNTTIISFCNLGFNNSVGSTVITVSGKVSF